MDTILKIALFSFAAACFIGLVLNLLIILFLNIFIYKKNASFPKFKRQVVYAIITGSIIWVIGWSVFLASVEMH